MTKETKKKFITICPKCNSTDVKTDFSNPGLVGTGLFVNAKVCNNCGYSSNFFPEIEEDKLPEEKKIKKQEKKELVNTTYGKNINWLWRFSGPIGIGLSIIFLFFYNVKAIFYLGLVGLLPLSCVLTLTAHRNDMIKKYPILKTISVNVFIYSITIAPILVMYLADLL